MATEKTQKVQRIHRILVILIIILAVALFLELSHEKGEWLMEEIKVEPQRQRYLIVPTLTWRVGFFEPEIDITETESEYIVRCDLPGVDKDKIELSVKGNYLTISGKRDIEREDTKGGIYYYRERRSGYFQRSIVLPGLVEEEGVKAEYKGGILEIRLPKRQPAREWKPKKVQII